MSKYRRVLDSGVIESRQSVTPSTILSLSWKHDHVEGHIGRRASISSLSDDAQIGLINHLRQEGISSARFAMTPGTGESSIVVAAQDTEKLDKLRVAKDDAAALQRVRQTPANRSAKSAAHLNA